jgi:hypothetical protein
MRFSKSAVILLATAFAAAAPQSHFLGKWQTRISSVTHKSTITVNIVEQETNGRRHGGAGKSKFE